MTKTISEARDGLSLPDSELDVPSPDRKPVTTQRPTHETRMPPAHQRRGMAGSAFCILGKRSSGKKGVLGNQVPRVKTLEMQVANPGYPSRSAWPRDVN